jgi:hypothetical protein
MLTKLTSLKTVEEIQEAIVKIELSQKLLSPEKEEVVAEFRKKEAELTEVKPVKKTTKKVVVEEEIDTEDSLEEIEA